jgi:hypothetical protein
MIKHRALTIAILAAVALAGCEKNEASKEETQQTAAPEVEQTGAEQAGAEQAAGDPASDQAGAARAQAGQKPTIKLLEPGAEPRRQLRYQLVKGAKETLIMTMNTSIQTKMPGMPTPAIKIPTMAMTMDLEVTEVLSQDEARYQFVMTGAEVTGGDGVMPELVEATRTTLEQAKGMKGTAIVDSRGFNRDATMELPDTIAPQMRQTLENTMQGMDQMSSPLPQEAVGKGAKWELHQQIDQNGMKVDQVTLFELVELNGDKGKLTAKVTQKAGKQKIEGPGMMGAKAELLQLDSTGSGVIQFNLAKLVPTSSISIASDYSVKVDAMGQVQTMDAHLEMSVDIRHK